MRKITILLLALILSLGFTGCAIKSTQEETEKIKAGTASNESILNFIPDDEGCRKLIEDMEKGEIPISCDVLYDQMGSRPSVLVEDENTIIQLYNLFSQIHVGEKTNESVTDCYHYVLFELQDGTKVGFSFENDIWIYGNDDERVKVLDAEPFWKMVRSLQDAE